MGVLQSQRWPPLTSGVKEILVRALEESGQLRGKEEKDLTALAESRKGLAKQKKGQSAQESQDKQRRGSNPGGNAQSAFRRLIINGVLSSFVPRPGPLVLCSKSSEDILIRKSQTYFLSSCSKRNAITSSYSSTRGFLQLQRMGPGAAGLLGPESSHLHEVSDKTREECHRPNPSVSMEPQRKIEDEKIADDHLRKKQNLNCSQSSDSSRPRKRKIPLLLPTRRNGPLILCFSPLTWLRRRCGPTLWGFLLPQEPDVLCSAECVNLGTLKTALPCSWVSGQPPDCLPPYTLVLSVQFSSVTQLCLTLLQLH